MADYGINLPTDAIVEVLLRLPTSSRRRFRLVCKQWRDLIDKRTPERQVRTKILAFIGQFNGSLAHVFDDGKDAFLRHTWTFTSPHEHVFIGMVGTCNGLLCLTEVHPRNGRVLVVVTNPVTGDKAKLPPSDRKILLA